MAASCTLGAVKTDVSSTLCSTEGWKQTGKYVLVALATLAALGLVLALTMRFCPSVANSGIGQQLSLLAGGKLMTYVLASSAALLGALAVGRAARCCMASGVDELPPPDSDASGC